MRKLITFLCFHLLITLSVYAQPSAIISGGTFSPGEIYTANFTTENFSNITRMNFSITWDTQVLEWIDVNGVENSEFANPDFYDTTDAANGVVVLRWTSPTDQGFTLADGEKLFDMRFRVIGTCGDKSSVRIVSTPERILVNKAGTSFNQNIGLNIEDALMGVCKLPLIVSTTTESGQMGDRICMPVIVENFDSIISVQLLVTWDSTVLQFDGVEGINLPDLDDDFFGIEGGRLFMSWFGPIDGTTVADGEQIFTICFKLIGDNGTRSTIDFNQDSEKTEIIGINYGDRNLGIVGRNGRISIRSQSGAAIAAPEEEVQPNGTVCIPITVHDFIEIRNMESELSWDVNVLQFISVSSNNALPGLLLDESNTATGTLGIRWQGFTSAGTTLDDGAIIFEICFRAIGTRGQFSDILFSETETIFTNASGQTFKNTEPGRISIPRETIILSATHAEGRSDSKVCIEIQVTNFNNVQQFGFPVNWEPSLARLDSVGAFSIASLEQDNFTIRTDVGNLSVEWSSNSFENNVSLPDGTTVFKLYFTLLDVPVTTCEAVSFDPVLGDPNGRVFFVQDSADSQPSMTDIQVVEGEICVLVSDLSISDSTIVAQSCSSSLDGSITVEVTGGTTPYLYRWNDAFRPSSPTIQGLAAGDYSLTVVDSQGDSVIAAFNVPLESAELVADAGVDTTLNCNSDTLVLNGLGSSMGENYGYSWNELDTGLVIDNGETLMPTIVGAGKYELVVFYINPNTGQTCQAFDEIEITDNSTAFANAGADQFICPGDTMTLDATVSGDLGNYVYEWTIVEDNPDNIGIIVSGGDTPTPRVLAGHYLLTVRDTLNQCADMDEIIILEYDDIHTATITSEAEQLTCDRSELVLEALISPTADYNINWTTEDGIYNTPTNTINASIGSAGTYILSVEDTVTTCTVRDTIVITTDDVLPEVFAGADRILDCRTVMLTINDSAPMGTQYTYAWAANDEGTIASGTEDDLNLTVTTAGTYVLTVTDTLTGCTASDELIVTNTAVDFAADAGADVVFGCGQETVQLDGTASNNVNDLQIEWQPANAVNMNPNDPLRPTVTATGTFVLLLTDTMRTGCTVTDTVEVIKDEGLPVINIAAPSEVTCLNNMVTLDASTSEVSEGDTYEWRVVTGGSNIINADSLIATVDAPGVFRLTITTDTGCFSSKNVEVRGDTTPPEVSITSEQELLIDCEMSQLTLVGNLDTAQHTFVWSTTDGNFSTTTNALVVNVDQVGTYELTATDKMTNCTTTTMVTVQQGRRVLRASILPPATLNCDQTTVVIDATASTLTSNTQISWDGGTNPILMGANSLRPTVGVAGAYTLTLTDAVSGCQDQQTITVADNLTQPTANAGADQNISCNESVVLDGGQSTLSDTYSWEAIDGGQIENGDRVVAVIASQPGTYILTVSNDTSFCTDTDTVVVTADAPLLPAEVEDNRSTCGATELTIMATTPTGDAIGEWTTPTNAFIADPMAAQTTIGDLQTGSNIFIWSLSTPSCPNYSSDTLVITVADRIVAGNDLQDYNETTGELIFDITANDVLTGVTNFDITLLSQPKIGSINSLEDGIIRYTAPTDIAQTDEFEYEICNLDCENACDTALVRIAIERTVTFQDSIDSFIPSGITPNGDGFNDALVFDLLENNPEQYADRELIIFNRWGDIVYTARPYTNDWAGTSDNGAELPQGTYYFILRLDIENGEIMKGNVTILK